MTGSATVAAHAGLAGTPTVVIDAAVLAANVTATAAAVRSKGIALRPHAKTHKLLEVARAQRDAGASGLTVATIGEAEVFVAAGFDDVFIAYPLWPTPESAARIAALADRAALTVGVDSPEAATRLGELLGGAAARLGVLIELDSGHHRSGIGPDRSVPVARAVVAAGLSLRGVFTFPGHSYAPGGRLGAAADESRTLAESVRVLEAAGFAVPVRSGGSSPSVDAADPDVVTEVRPGVYVFGDAQQWELGAIGPDAIALTVHATVVSRHDGPDHRRVVVDAGSKILGGDRPTWTTGYGRLIDHPDARITALSEHHATVVFPDEVPLPELGSRLRVIPNHVCAVLNLVDEVTVVRDGAVVDVWAVAARGRNG